MEFGLSEVLAEIYGVPRFLAFKCPIPPGSGVRSWDFWLFGVQRVDNYARTREANLVPMEMPCTRVQWYRGWEIGGVAFPLALSAVALRGGEAENWQCQ